MRASRLLAGLGVAAGVASGALGASAPAALAQLAPPLAGSPSPAREGPPPPVVLAPGPSVGSGVGGPAAVAAFASVPLPPSGFAVLPGGAGWRLTGPAARGTPDAREAAALAALGRAMGERTPTGRVTLVVRVAGPDDDPSTARRESLARARALEAALVAGGLDPTRVDLRPLGRTEEGADAVDLLPPPAPRPEPVSPPAAAPPAPSPAAQPAPTARGASSASRAPGAPAEAARR